MTSITIEDGLYVLETLLRWRGIKLVPAGRDKLKAVPEKSSILLGLI